MENATREQIQTEALEAIVKHSVGTICLSTGTGKSKVAIDFIKRMPNILRVLITSPRTNLKENWKAELIKWGLEIQEHRSDIRWKIAGTDRYVWIFIDNIQTAYKYKGEQYDLIIADEIHTMMTPEYSDLFKNNKYDYLLGLTATHDITRKNDKSVFYNRYCPIIYEYYDSAEHGLINKTTFYVVDHKLDNETKIIVGNKKKSIETNELSYYEYLTEKIKSGQNLMIRQGSQDWFTDAASWFWKGQGTKEQKFAAMMYLNGIKARKDFLLNLPSSAKVAQKIKDGILSVNETNKVLIFSELTAQVDRISSFTVHSNNHKDKNVKYMSDFDSGILRELGSCQSLTLGLNLKGATHAIMESYIGSATQSKQKKGRLDRLATDDVAEMWIIRVVGTQADTWFEQMAKGFNLTDAEHFNSNLFLNDKFDFTTNSIRV